MSPAIIFWGYLKGCIYKDEVKIIPILVDGFNLDT